MSKVSPVSPDRPQRAEPVRADERVEFVDILRGFAVFGILVANMYGFAGLSRDPGDWSGIDRVIVLLTRFLIEAKFYSLFSLLFGWGMAVQMLRAEARGTKFVPRFLRRLFVLLIIGVSHGVLLWDGDILTFYALLGFLLLLFRRRSGKVLLPAAGLALLLSIGLSVPGSAMGSFHSWYENLTDFLRSSTYPERLFATGTYGEITRLRFQEFVGGQSWFIYFFGNVFGMFLLGLWVGKRRFFQEARQHLSLIRMAMWVGLGIGVTFNAVFASTIARPEIVPPEYYRLASRGARTLGAPALMLFYVCGIILLVQKESWHHRLAPLAAVGRTALSNYLFQSVLCTLIFNGYGLGLYGEIDPPLALALTVVVFLTQVRLSAWWLAHYQFGPIEWVWRTLTYGRFQRLQRGEAGAGREDTLRRRIRQAAARVDPQAALVVVWAVLLLWAGVLGYWYVRQESEVAQPSVEVEVPQTADDAIATPIVAQVDDLPEATPEVIATPAVQPVAFNPGPIAASGDLLALATSFSPQSAMHQIEIITGPPFLGRYAGSAEGWAAGDYIAGQFAKYGLQPAGEEGTFFQPFPMEYIALAREPSLAVEGPDGKIYDDYVVHQDFSPVVRQYSGPGTVSGEVIWASTCDSDDFRSLNVVDKIVLCRYGAVREIGR